MVRRRAFGTTTFALACSLIACSGDDGGSGSGGGAHGGSVNDVPALDLSSVVWLDQDISGWPQGAVLSSVTFPQQSICLSHNLEGRGWPTAFVNDETVVANAWVFLEHGGTTYAAVWHFLRAEPSFEKCLDTSEVNGLAINIAPFNQPPFDPPLYWQPASGELFYFMVSGFVRNDLSNVQRRSNIVGAYWP